LSLNCSALQSRAALRLILLYSCSFQKQPAETRKLEILIKQIALSTTPKAQDGYISPALFNPRFPFFIPDQNTRTSTQFSLQTKILASFKLQSQPQSINMPFFQPAYLSPEASFFQLLSELDQPTHKVSCRPQRRAETFTPRFDVTETTESYELYGEVPGLSQEDLSIEFSDAQTLIIKGKTQRALNTTENSQPEQSTTTSEKGKERESDSSSEKSHAPTVEDDYDDVDAPVATPATSATATVTQEQPQTTEAATAAAPEPKFWVAERKVGEFARSFSFSQRIEQDFVSADLKAGILHVVVPKSLKSRKVTVTVN
jgi:HSP20 family protein